MTLGTIFELCLIPLMGIAVAFLVSFLQAKKAEVIEKVNNDLADKYIAMAFDTVADCVLATKQTYVDSLKAQGAFDKEAQKKAFQDTLDAVLELLTDEAKDFLAESYGDLNKFLATRIEA